MVTVKLISNSCIVILITVLFQCVTKSWITLAIIFVVLCLIGTFYIAIFVPESALWLFSNEMFEESR